MLSKKKKKKVYFLDKVSFIRGFPGGSAVKKLPANAGDVGLDPGVRKITWRRKWQPTPVFLPGKSHGQRNLAGDGPWGRRVRHG